MQNIGWRGGNRLDNRCQPASELVEKPFQLIVAPGLRADDGQNPPLLLFYFLT